MTFKNILTWLLLTLLTIIVVFILICVYFYYVGSSGERAQKDEGMIYVDSIPKSYANIFNITQVKSIGTVFSKVREPISEFDYRSKYDILLYKLPTINSHLLYKTISEKYISVDNTNWVSYHLISNENFFYETLYKFGHPDISDKIYLTLFGKNAHAIEKNDSVAYYYLNLGNFSMRYKQDGDNDFYTQIRQKYSGTQLPMEIMFLKRKKSIYMFLMICKSPDQTMDEKLLYSLIEK